MHRAVGFTRRRAGSRARLVAIGLVVTVVAVSCGSDGEPGTAPAGNAAGVDDPTSDDTGAESDEQVAGTNDRPIHDGDGASPDTPGDRTAVIVRGVDSVTATGLYDELHGAGFTDFLMQGSSETGFTVHRPGLSAASAQALLDDVAAALFPGATGGNPGVVMAMADVDFPDERPTVGTDRASVSVGDQSFVVDGITLPHQCSADPTRVVGTLAVDAARRPVEGGSVDAFTKISFAFDLEAGPDASNVGVNDLGTGVQYQAGAGIGEVTSVTVEGRTVRGEGRFVDLASPGSEPVDGTFEITCEVM